MTEQDIKMLKQDADGLATYEYLANNIETCFDDLDAIIDNMTNVDRTGQFLASAARYLHAIDSERYAAAVEKLVAATIDKDREHAYLPSLIRGIYGDNFAEGAEERCATDRNFRRMYQRLFPRPDSL
ncbi:MAG: hypothetical protein K2F97_01665 [Muribaculaceae bacterium]|nr:hypothetical protein [Muribaculaceae bacterium]MDE6487272.1 hypothetical protein [Muribaculaceae bacterium]